MITELINIGSELMLGRVLNTHQQWLCRRLADRGYIVSRQTAISDVASEIEQAVREALSRADLVITTGGLGPTSDDITREIIAQMLGRKLREDSGALAQIEKFFAMRNRPMPERARVEAQAPEGAIVLPNPNGTAPGLAMEIPPGNFRSAKNASWLIMFPGPPRELRPMFTDFALPLIERAFPAPEPFVCRTFRTAGIPELTVQETLENPLRDLVSSGLEIGYCARPGQVDVRFVTHGESAEKLAREAEAILRSHLGAQVFGEEEDAIENVIVRLLTERGETLALAESCTGGCIANRITNVPGASAILKGSFVTYSNDMKQRALGVRVETLSTFGAVSEAVAREMAEGARRVAESDFAISVTGIAGPSGGSEDKPVGTVFIALASREKTEVWKMFNPWDRTTFKDVTAQQALDFLRRRISNI
jgi:nicotinamide-nucleotide amidase